MAKDVKFTDLFDPNKPRSDKALIEQRLAICNVCPAFKKNTKRCGYCGCFMQLKSTLQQAKCPVDKW
jgi:hypothetical protein